MLWEEKITLFRRNVQGIISGDHFFGSCYFSHGKVIEYPLLVFYRTRNLFGRHSSFKIIFLHFFITASVSSSVMVLAKVAKLCWKYFIVSIKTTWFPICAKLISVGVFFHLLKCPWSSKSQTLSPSQKKRNQNEKGYVLRDQFFSCFFVPWGYNNCDCSQLLSPVICELCMWISLYKMPLTFSINFSHMGIPFTLSVSQKSMMLEYTKQMILSIWLHVPKIYFIFSCFFFVFFETFVSCIPSSTCPRCK